MTTAAPAITLRARRGLDDLAGMAAANQRLRTQLGLIDPVDLEGMQHRYTHLVNSDPAADVAIAVRDGSTVGYARVEWHNRVAYASASPSQEGSSFGLVASCSRLPLARRWSSDGRAGSGGSYADCALSRGSL